MLLKFMVCGHIAFGNITWEQLGLVLLFAMVGVIAVNLPYWKRKGPVIECQATVKSKRMEYSNTPQIYARGNRWNFLVLFVDENGKEVELHTNENHYHELSEGDTGKLVYQRDLIIKFDA